MEGITIRLLFNSVVETYCKVFIIILLYLSLLGVQAFLHRLSFVPLCIPHSFMLVCGHRHRNKLDLSLEDTVAPNTCVYFICTLQTPKMWRDPSAGWHSICPCSLKPSSEKYIWDPISSMAILALMWKYDLSGADAEVRYFCSCSGV